MFVWVGNFAEGFGPCDSVVRLQPLDPVDVEKAKSCEALSPEGTKTAAFFLDCAREIRDRELRTVWTSPGVMPREFIDQVIKRRAEVIDDFSGENGHLGQDSVQHMAADDCSDAVPIAEFSDFRLLIGVNFFLVRFLKTTEDSYQLCDMNIGPFHAEECAVEGGVACLNRIAEPVVSELYYCPNKTPPSPPRSVLAQKNLPLRSGIRPATAWRERKAGRRHQL